MYSHIIVVEESWDIACILTSGYDNLALYSPFIYPLNFYSQPLCQAHTMPATSSTTLANRATSWWAVHVFWVRNIHLAVQLCTPHHLQTMTLAESLSHKDNLSTIRWWYFDGFSELLVSVQITFQQNEMIWHTWVNIESVLIVVNHTCPYP